LLLLVLLNPQQPEHELATAAAALQTTRQCVYKQMWHVLFQCSSSTSVVCTSYSSSPCIACESIHKFTSNNVDVLSTIADVAPGQLMQPGDSQQQAANQQQTQQRARAGSDLDSQPAAAV
jgi:hypothetical protein